MDPTINYERRELEITEAANEMTKRFSWRNGYATLVDAFIEGAKWADANPAEDLAAAPTISDHPKKTL